MILYHICNERTLASVREAFRGGRTFLLHVFTWGWVMCHDTYVEIREQFVRILLIHHVSPID